MVITCPECGKENDSAALLCSSCGFPFKESVTCPDCNKLNEKDATICSHCGCPLKSETKKPKKIKKLVIAIVAAVLIPAIIISGCVFGVSKSKKEFQEKLLNGNPWVEAETDVKITFTDKGLMSYLDMEFHGIMEGLEYQMYVCEYEVLTGDRIKIGDKTVKIIFRTDGKVEFEPEIAPLVQKASAEYAKGE